MVDSAVYPSTWHSAASIGIDRLGYIHVAGNMHSSPWQYHRSTAPEDISSWQFLGQYAGANKGHTIPAADVRESWLSDGTAVIPGNQITYAFFRNDQRGRLYVAYRECYYCDRSGYYSREWSGGLSAYDEQTQSWERIGGVRPWAHDTAYVAIGMHFAFDTRNNMHVSWIWYPHYKKYGSHDTAPNFPTYARSGESHSNFQRSDLHALSLPLDFSQSDTLWSPFDLKQNNKGYFERYTDLAIAPNGSPYVVLMPKSASEGRKRSFTTYVPGFGWIEPQPMPWAATRLLIDSEGMMTAISGGIRIHRKKLSEQNWKTYKIDVTNGGCLVTPDYRYFDETGKLRIYAVQNKKAKSVGVRIYSVEYEE
ncbi:MAG: hypothetical protein DWQ10_15605 [Calditrichaeota bacterium]|nr:MAG: hypothetical protein DWQ10_15605 [Calditrichota bacterium]